MPPSPSLMRSPRGDPRGKSHKREHSLEHGLSFKEKDDDLALFNEIQNRERENFLLESTDDFEDLLSSKTKPFLDFKLGINIPARGESSDLLNADADKNDYKWLLTPPETPLFTSLDDEPVPVNLVHSGRARSRPISTPGSSMMERSHRSRGSPSPQHSSPSPRSVTSSFHGRASSAPHSNPRPSHSNSPLRRPLPHQVKPTAPPRSVTPNSRRKSSGSPSSVGMSGLRGTSPVRVTRGNSASPKIRAWQSNIPGFSLEAPPNLRTSLADRPASYVRGSSPASRTSRQSMSPTPSRSIGSSPSQDRDRLSLHSKGSVVSSGDDDADSLQSVSVTVSERPMLRKGVSGYPSGRLLSFSKKSSKAFSPSFAPKRSFDPALRQMNRKPPPNMFRPLLSSFPGSTFYSEKPTTSHHALMSRNSSVTTSSNASFDVATSAVLNAEGIDKYQDDRAGDSAMASSGNHDDVFVFDKVDARPINTGSENHDCSVATHQPDLQSDAEVVDTHGDTLICSICGSRYRPEMAENENNICFECKRREPTVSQIAHNQECMSGISHRDGQYSQSDMENSDSVLIEPESMDVISEQQVTRGHKTLDDPSHTGDGGNCISDMTTIATEGTGISVLLNRSSSVKVPIVHGKTIIHCSAISFEDLSYARDLTSSLRSSTGHGSFSVSSSVDLASTREGETFVRRQLSGKLSDSNSKPQSTVSSFSGTSVPVYQGVGLSTSCHEESCEGSLGNVRHIVVEEMSSSPSDLVVAFENGEPAHMIEFMSSTEVENMSKHETDEDQQNRIVHIQNVRESEFTEASLAEDGTMSENMVPPVDVVEDSCLCSISTMLEIEINDSCPSSPRSQIDLVFREDLEDSSAAIRHDTDVKDDSAESVHTGRIVEESTLTMEDPEGSKVRSLTLDEATATILFCNSIVHELAYKAASIAIEKEKENLEPFEPLRPTITMPDRSGYDLKDLRGFSSGRALKTQKARKKQTEETETKPPLTQNDEKSNNPVVRKIGLRHKIDSMNPLKLESKCNCTIM